MDSEISDLSSLSREELQAKILELELDNLLLKKLSLGSSHSPPNNVKLEEKETKPNNFDFSKYTRRHVLMQIAYLGWDRYGFAIQKHTENTVEAVVIDALLTAKLIQSRKDATYHRCGRTDRNVSALSQMISLTARSNVDYIEDKDGKKCPNNSPRALKKEFNYPKLLNKILPPDVRVLAWSPVPEGFSARFHCKRRVYKYFFPRANLDLEAMRKAAQYLVGNHDFRNFCKWNIKSGVLSYVRTIFTVSLHEVYDTEDIAHSGKDSAFEGDEEEEKEESEDEEEESEDEREESEDDLSWQKAYTMCVLKVEGLGFLWHQIRAIIAILFLVGEGKEEPQIVQKFLDVSTLDKKPPYMIATGIGLNLYDAQFDNETISWQFDQENLSAVLSHIQSIWNDHATKAVMLHQMLLNISSIFTSNFPTESPPVDQIHASAPECHKKPYKPLLDRPRNESVESRVKDYVERDCLNPEVLKKVKAKFNL